MPKFLFFKWSHACTSSVEALSRSVASLVSLLASGRGAAVAGGRLRVTLRPARRAAAWPRSPQATRARRPSPRPRAPLLMESTLTTPGEPPASPCLTAALLHIWLFYVLYFDYIMSRLCLNYWLPIYYILVKYKFQIEIECSLNGLSVKARMYLHGRTVVSYNNIASEQ